MLETKKPIEKGGVSPVWLILGAAALLAGTAVFFLQQKADQPAVLELPELTDEARAYLPNLDLSADTGMEAKDDALGQTLLEITGAITNNGDRTCSSIRVNVVFKDINETEIDRQLSSIVNARTGPLEPGETQQFRLAFDNVPLAWNQAFPSLFIAEIDFR